MKEELYFKDCFTEIEEGKVNAEFNKATVKCFDSKDNKFSMDCEGNLVVNSIIAREGNNTNTTVNVDTIYPVGSIYMSVTNANPGTLFGGTWEAINGRFLLASGSNVDNTTNYWGTYNAGTCNFPLGEMSGEPFHTLSYNEMPTHSHTMRGELRYANTSWWIGGTGGTTIEVGDINTDAAGAGWPHNNMPPYLVVNVWKRVS